MKKTHELNQLSFFQEPKEVHPLAPPPSHKKEGGEHEHDPYLKTEAELSHHDFSGPFFYSSTKNIIRKEKKDGKPSDGHHEKPGFHTIYRYY